jgi:NAD-dependent dihydropyrimidine dehydrogenase PreA subunit
MIFRRKIPAAAILLLVCGYASFAFASERFPPPDFLETDHQLPETAQPSPRGANWVYLDVALLTMALVLAAFWAHKARSRRRLFWLSVASLAYFGFIRHGCVCPIGAIQNVALALSDSAYAVPWPVVAFFAIPLAFALFFGRVFCSGVCPLGALQELTLLKPKAVPGEFNRALGLLPYFYLGVGVLFAACGSAFLICRYDPYVGFFRLSGPFGITLFGGLLLLLGLFIGRPYCRWLCPYGALLSLLSRLSRRKITVTPNECIRCKLCAETCPYGAILPPTVGAGLPKRSAGKIRLALLLAAIPVFIGLGAWLGNIAKVPLSRMDFSVRLAERVWADQNESAKAGEESDEVAAFRRSDASAQALYERADAVRARYAVGGTLLGAWVGLVLGAQLVALSVRRKREGFEADPAACVACGRCFEFCPHERERRGLPVEPLAAAVAATEANDQ